MKCPYCNHEVGGDSKFCENCGKPIKLKTADDIMKENVSEKKSYSDDTLQESALDQHYRDPQHSYNQDPNADSAQYDKDRYNRGESEQRCKNCGGVVDPMTKRCRSCGNKAAGGGKGLKIALIIVSVLAVGAAVFALDQMVGLRQAKQTISQLHSDMDYYEEKSDFMDDYIVFVVEGDETYYHTYDCDALWDADTFYAYNISNAEYMGYQPAPDCH